MNAFAFLLLAIFSVAVVVLANWKSFKRGVRLERKFR